MLIKKYQGYEDKATLISLALGIMVLIVFMISCVNTNNVQINGVISVVAIVIIRVIHIIVEKKIKSRNKKVIENYEQIFEIGKEIECIINAKIMQKNKHNLTEQEMEILNIIAKGYNKIYLCREYLGSSSSKLIVKIVDLEGEVKYRVLGIGGNGIDYYNNYCEKGYLKLEIK